MRETPYPNQSNTWDGGIFLPGWHCRAEDCGIFNGEPVRQVKGVDVKTTHDECRSCGRPRGWADNPDIDDPGEHDCHPVFLSDTGRTFYGHRWAQDSSGVCVRCGARAVRGVFGERLRLVRSQTRLPP